MATESPISLLKSFFITFFRTITKPQKKDYDRSRFGSSQGEMAYKKALLAWSDYVKNSKGLILSYSPTVTSLVDVIGQEGVNAFNTWIETYASGTGPVPTDGLKALQDWYNKYLKPLS